MKDGRPNQTKNPVVASRNKDTQKRKIYRKDANWLNEEIGQYLYFN